MITSRDPMDIVMAMVTNENIPLERMEKAIAIVEMQMEKQDAKEASMAFNSSLVEAKKAFRPVVMRGKNNQFGGKAYALLEDVQEAVDAALTTNGFTYTFDVEFKDGEFTTVCKLVHIQGGSEKSAVDLPILKSNNATNEIQARKASMTYAKGITLVAVTGVRVAEGQLPGGDGNLNQLQVGTLTDLQVQHVNKLCGDAGRTPAQVLSVMNKRLKINVESISELPESSYDSIVKTLSSMIPAETA